MAGPESEVQEAWWSGVEWSEEWTTFVIDESEA